MSWRTPGTPPPPTMGLLELSSIARGIHATDRMLKASKVELVLSRTICSGKFMIVIAGELRDVEASMAAGRAVGDECTIDHMILADVHPDVYPAITATTSLTGRGAIGIIESFSVASLVEAIDKVAKAAPVEMVQCRLAMAMGGKAFLVFCGDVEAVGYAMAAGAEVVERRGLLVNKVVIPDPRPELFETLI